MAVWINRSNGVLPDALTIRGKTIPRPLLQVLANRGIVAPDEIERFFAPSLDDLHDPFLMPDMDKAVARVTEARTRGESVLIHGDYDTDGITGIALLQRTLERLGLDVATFVPRRLIEGYGLSRAGLESALERKCRLVITVDCGITADEEIAFAAAHGLDVIVCDHHQPKSMLPRAHSLLNPRLPDCPYPFKDLAGVGVAFKFCQALQRKHERPVREIHDDLDLVALGTVVDVVPLTGENRILVKAGLQRMNKTDKPGLRALLEDAGVKREVAAYHLGFILGPRINACGRLRDAAEALRLLTTTSPEEARRIARNLSRDNRQRQAIEDEILNQAITITAREGYDRQRVLVLDHPDWHEGIVGIVASRMAERYTRPAILLARKHDRARGSARSVPGFDITAALAACAQLLVRFGGHKQAAGLELAPEHVPELRRCINDYAASVDGAIFAKKTHYDVEIGLTDIDDGFLHFLKYFEPTGMDNPQPVFLARDLAVVGTPRVVGNDHLKLTLRRDDRTFEAIAFGQGRAVLGIEPDQTRLDCLFTVTADTYGSRRKYILKLKEFKTAEQ